MQLTYIFIHIYIYIYNRVIDNKEEIKSDLDSEDRMWYDNIEEISEYIKKQNKKNKNEELILTVEYWKKLNAKKWKKLDQILMELQEFVGVTNFDLRMVFWERVDNKIDQKLVDVVRIYNYIHQKVQWV